MISIEISHKADVNWNKRLIQSPFGTTAQIQELTFQFEKNNEIPYFLRFIDSSGNIVGQLLLSESLRFNDSTKKTKILNHLGKFSNILSKSSLKTKFFKWSYGPVIFNSEYSSEIYLSLQNFLLSHKSHLVLGWQHPFAIDGIESLDDNFNLIKWSTFAIDLSKSKEELLQNIDKHSGRKNIQRAIKRGITIMEIDDTNLYDYFLLLNESKESSNPINSNYELFSKMWNILKPYGRGGFLAKKDGIPISGLSFSSLCGHIIEGGVARSSTDKTNVLYSQDLIKWKIIEWGLENNMKWYNLAGFNPEPVSEKEKGIFRFKKKWGGKQFNYNGIQLK